MKTAPIDNELPTKPATRYGIRLVPLSSRCPRGIITLTVVSAIMVAKYP